MPEKRERTEESANDSDDEMEAEFDDGNNKQGTNSDEDKTEAMSMSVAMTEGKDLVNKTKNKNKSHFSNELIAQYYSRLFPFHLLHEWLSYNTNTASENNSNNKTFTHREFSFTIEPSPGEEIYIRYQSFKDQAELTAAVIKRNPRKIDIGAVFSHPPKDHHAIQGSTQRKFAPAQRELVFDVDLTDYDCVRKCGCSEANICLKCWKMMGMAIKVMDQGLKEDFGFKNIAWFYSGRRGVHAWICDESARKLSDAGRSAVATYFEVRACSATQQQHPLKMKKQVDALLLLPLSCFRCLAKSFRFNVMNRSIWEQIRIKMWSFIRRFIPP
jgi:DNA primase small subunit